MILSLGITDIKVNRLQQIFKLAITGKFDRLLENKVKEWQSANGLKADGKVGQFTWNKLVNGIDLAKLKGSIPDYVFSQIIDICGTQQLDSPLRLAHFLSQCAHESGNFSQVFENLNYSADGLAITFKSDFDLNKNKVLEATELLKTRQLARKPEAIANFVYANQNGNGNELSGDGWKFRGRGYIQLTGRANYEKFSKYIGEDCTIDPDLVATQYPLASAKFFFDNNKLWSICDLGSDSQVVVRLTKRINGGTNGLADRIQKFTYFWTLLK